MQSSVPAPGALLWIRQARWRVVVARREREVLRLDVTGAAGRATFLSPFDRAVPAAGRPRPRRIRPRRFAAQLAEWLTRPASVRSLRTAADAAIAILPFQLEPALAMLSGTRRILIADAVGLGKTIQAGLVIAELQQRLPALRVLIVAPGSLRRQWASELSAHFSLQSACIDAESLDALGAESARGGNPWQRPGVTIGSVDFVKQRHVLPAACATAWDLLIADEAHSTCGDSERHAAMAALAARSRRVILLSATPHSGEASRFQQLLNLGALPSDAGAPLIFRRTRASLGVGANRRIQWHRVGLTARERAALDALTEFEQFVLSTSPGDRPGVLLLSVFRKRALSTFHAFVVSIERRLTWLENRNAAPAVNCMEYQPRLAFDAEDEFGEDERASLTRDVGVPPAEEHDRLRRLHRLGTLAARDESKLHRAAVLARRSREPIAMFTEFRDSLQALGAALRAVRPVELIHGGLPLGDQQAAIDRFVSGRTSLLAATDVASQGLNLQQRCRTIVNLELPWNPVRLEQRAGRVDRIGQRHRVHIHLLVAGHDAEAGVLARLTQRALTAGEWLGTDLQPTTPDESAVRNHLVGGAALVQPESTSLAAAPVIRWRRPGRAAARRVNQGRVLVRARGFPRAASRPLVADFRSSPRLRRLAAGGCLLCFSVPLVDGRGAIVETRAVALRVGFDVRDVLRGGSAFDAACAVATACCQARLRRLRRLAARQRDADAAVERDIFDLLLKDVAAAELQPGLFDRRTIRVAAAKEGLHAQLRLMRADRLAALDAEAGLEVERPVLELAIGDLSNPGGASR